MITQGKWYTKAGKSQMVSDDTTVITIIHAARDTEQAHHVFTDADTHGDAVDDAALIAAAPELLAVCKDRLDVLWDLIGGICSCKPGEESHLLSPDDQAEYLKLNAEWEKIGSILKKANLRD